MTYYDITLGDPIPHGSDILNKPCNVLLVDHNGEPGGRYNGTVFAWFTVTTVRITSLWRNLYKSWLAAKSGTLTIDTGNLVLTFPIVALTQVMTERPYIRRRVYGATVTELDHVVPDIPIESISWGAGFDAIRGVMCATAVQPFAVKEPKVKSSETSIHLIQEESEYNSELATSVSGKYNIQGVTAKGSAEWLSKIKYDELSTTLVASYESNLEGYDEADSYRFTPEAEKLLKDPKAFRQAFGDYFVAGGRRSARFLAIYVCRASTVSDMMSFKASFGAEAPDMFSAEGSASFTQSAKQYKIQKSIYVYMQGEPIKSNPPGPPWTPEKVLEALQWFKANEEGRYARMKLKHYSTIDPTYPRTIDIAPSIFVDLSLLYLKLWDIRSRFASLPAVYQSRLLQQYAEIDYGIVANQSVLPTDAAERKKYHDMAYSFMLQLNDVFARMDFYYRVKGKAEPAEGDHIQATDGLRSWLFGVNESDAAGVAISSVTKHYKEDWHIGWRESTLEFNNSDQLVVGWEVISNWSDGTNGQWWKDTPRILLTGQARVHVKSLYDRGCDWSLRVYFVPRKDYQFEQLEQVEPPAALPRVEVRDVSPTAFPHPLSSQQTDSPAAALPTAG